MIETFDIIAWLEDQGIDYATEGKNVSAGWVEVNCPFCGDDPSYHLGINLESKMIHCWRCGTKGPVTKYIREVLQCSWAMANTIVARYQLPGFEVPTVHQKGEGTSQELIYHPMVEDGLKEPHRRYLRKRGFDPNVLEAFYQLKHTGFTGDSWGWRIFCPVIENSEEVAYTARKIKSTAKGPKWKGSPNEKSRVHLHHTLYNLDNHTPGRPLVIVEGVFDVWRIGDGAVACFGTELSWEQIRKIREHNPSRIYIAFDGEEKAIQQAHKQAVRLATFVETAVLELPPGRDPDALPEEDIQQIRALLRR